MHLPCLYEAKLLQYSDSRDYLPATDARLLLQFFDWMEEEIFSLACEFVLQIIQM